jgi:hypothetical protein
MIPDDRQQFAMQGRECLSQLPPGCQQWLHDIGELRHALNQFPDPFGEFDHTDGTDLEPEVAQKPSDVVFDRKRLFL